EDREAHQLLDHLFFARLANGIQLDLACGRGGHRREIAHAWRRLPLLEADSPAHGVAHDILIVGDRDTHTHTRALADLRRPPRLVGNLGHDLLHELREARLDALDLEGRALRLHDRHLMLDGTWVVRADLGAEAVFERRDDTPAVGVVLRIGAD